jgi:hypothetical protein
MDFSSLGVSDTSRVFNDVLRSPLLALPKRSVNPGGCLKCLT